MSRAIAVVHEARADFLMATGFADRVFLECFPEWLEEDLLPSQRTWLAEIHVGPLTWKGIKKLAHEAGIRVHGHFDGEPPFPDAAAARRAILFLLLRIPELKAIVLMRDQDDQPERRLGLEQARNADRSGLPIVVGLAVVERESWLISGFEPSNELETARLESERQNLGFDPSLASHELTACKDDFAKRSPKRVLRELTGGDKHREGRCWQEPPSSLLHERGSQNGLKDYLEEVREKLAPLIGHVGAR